MKTGLPDGMIRLTITDARSRTFNNQMSSYGHCGAPWKRSWTFYSYLAAAMHLTSSPKELSPAKFSPAGDGLYYLAVSVRFVANVEATPHRGERFND
jgi:hypothetical protein